LKRVRVLVANRPRLMRELVLATIADQPDIEVVGEVIEESDLTEIVEEVQPDALILTLDNPEEHSALCGFLLGRFPRMRILALAPERNQGIYYWAVVDIHAKKLESSEATLLRALRASPPLRGDLAV
jgi:chemotaxis response regulator CheB